MDKLDTKKTLNKAATKSLAVSRPYSIDDETFNRFKEALAWLNAHPELWYDRDMKSFKELSQSSAIVGLVNSLISFADNLKAGNGDKIKKKK